MSKLKCQNCGSTLLKQRPQMALPFDFLNGIASGFALEIVFWLLFAAALGLGLWHWAAGTIAFLAIILPLYFWERKHTKYKCESCNRE
jgi:DNA-directed RNA polymerase subunit RPC12/RpoP